MSAKADVLIVGGGVIGLTTAYFLSREGVRVDVVDRGDFGQEASWAGAGILPPGNFEHASSPCDALRAQSSAMFPLLTRDLRELTGIDNGYAVTGGLEFPHAGEEPAIDEWRSEGIQVEEVTGERLHQLEPALAPELQHAYFLPGMGQVRNPRHVKALLAACEKHGVNFRRGQPVHGFECRGEHISAAKTAGGSIAADRFLLATGAWSDSLLEPFGFHPGIHPVRGQIAMLNTGVPVIKRVLLHGNRYLVPRLDARILVGSTEEDAGFDKRTTAGAINGLLDFAIRVIPALVDAHLERSWAGLRPGSPDGLPYLGSVPGTENLFVAAGHFRAGIQLSPATGLALKELLLGQHLTISLEPFRLDRTPGQRRRMTFRS